MRFLGGIDRGAQLVGAPVQWVEQDVGTGAVELLNEAPGCVIDDRPLTCLADALEHGGDEVGLPRSGSADQQDMLRLEGVGHGDAADRKGALLLPPKRAANLGDSPEAGAAQIFVGPQAAPGAGKIEPGEYERRQGAEPRYGSPVDEVLFQLVERLLADTGFEKGIGRGPVLSTVRGTEQQRVDGSPRGIGLEACLTPLADRTTVGLGKRASVSVELGGGR